MSHVILHLSDFHFKGISDQNPVLAKSTNIVDALILMHPLAQSVTIMATGDLSFSGKTEEFDLAGEFLSNIRDELIKLGKKVEVICVPGNHDCDFLESKPVREKLIANIDVNRIDSEYIELIISVQNNYREFIDKFGFKGKLVDLIERFEVDFEDLRVELCLINSAWISQLQEVQGILIFPPTILEAVKTNGPNFIFTLLHHPYTWFESENARKIRNEIERFSEVVLTGHEHTGDNYERKVQGGKNTTYNEGLILQKASGKISSLEGSGFRSIEISVDSMRNDEVILDFFQYEYSIRHCSWAGEKVGSKGLTMFTRKNDKYPEFTNEFLQILDDAGARVLSNHHVLKLADFFVYPDLRIVDYSTKDKSKNVNRPILPYFFDNKRVFIFGKEKTGKTALARTLCKEFYLKRYSPILITGEDIKGTTSGDLIKLIDEKYKTFYQPKDHQDLLRLAQEQKVLILDDFHTCRFNDKEKRKLLLKIDSYFGTIIVFSSSDLQISEIFSGAEVGDIFISYKTLHLLPFGMARRDDLIEKWVRLGRENTIEDSYVNHEIVEIERVLSKTLGKKLIPSVPIFLITLLMQHDHPERFSNSITAGSFASLYEALINFSLIDVIQDRKINLEKIHVFLSDFAYYLYKQDTKIISESKLKEWFAQRNERKGLTLDFQTIKTRVIQAQLLSQFGDSIGFKFDYAYYFYLAGHFELNKHNDQTLEEVHELIRSLPNYKDSSLLNFISYRCNHPKIYEYLIEKCDELYSEYPPMNLATDFNHVGEKLHDSRNSTIEPKNYHGARKIEHEAVDKLVSVIESDNEEDLSIDNAPANDLRNIFDDLFATFQLLDVIGQLLRNLSSSMDLEDKKQLLIHSLRLCLRQMKHLSIILDTNKETLSQNIVNVVKAIDEATDNLQEHYDPEELFSSYTVYLFSALFQSYAELLSTEETPFLLERFPEKEIDKHSLLLMKLLIKIFYFGEDFPYADLGELRRELKTINFTYLILLKALERYFALFDVHESEQEKIISQIGFRPTKMSTFQELKFKRRRVK